VLEKGFAVLAGAPGDRHVVAVDLDGQQPKRLAVPVVAPDARLVGVPSAPAIAWLDKEKIHIAALKGDGELGKESAWGRVRFMCTGVATNDQRWAVAWHDRDNKIWFVHGPTRDEGKQLGDDLEVAGFDATTAVTQCGVASAYDQVALWWRDGARTYL